MSASRKLTPALRRTAPRGENPLPLRDLKPIADRLREMMTLAAIM